MDPVDDLAERLPQQFVGAERPDLPTGYLQQPEEGRLYWSGTLARVIGVAQFTLSSSRAVRAGRAAAGPAPVDAMAVFLTGEDLLGRPLTTDQMGAALASESDSGGSWRRVASTNKGAKGISRMPASLLGRGLKPLPNRPAW
jgi:hypothetical protein